MPKLDGLGQALDFLKGLQPKIAAQIAKKIFALNLDPLPSDSKALVGYPSYFRVDIGEYRIVYSYVPSDDLVQIILVDKRDDDEVYKRLKRLLGY